MENHVIGWAGGTVGFNIDNVLKGIDDVGWGTLLNYVTANVGVGSSGIYSTDMILIDTSKTGSDAIIGAVPINNQGTDDQAQIWDQWSREDVSLLGGRGSGTYYNNDYGFGNKQYYYSTDQGGLANAKTSSSFNETYTLKDGQTVNVDLNGLIFTSSPIVFDLKGSGHPDLLAGPHWAWLPGRRLDGAALRGFNLDGSGKALWEWAGPNAGILVWDPQHTGRIASGQQLFGNHTWGKSWKDGYQALATLDKQHSGWLSGNELDNLAIWRDANSNGTADPGEVVPVRNLGIEEIAVRPYHDRIGNAWAPEGFVAESPNGSKHTLASWDWIAMGVAKAKGGTYAWVGQVGRHPIGGFLRLREDGGVIRGLSVPTVGVVPPAKNVIAALPIAGVDTGHMLHWRTPAPKGTSVISQVLLLDHGKRLAGRTTVDTPRGHHWSYDWQAQLVSGLPVRR
ncbi:MAG: hypothetical protein KGR26_13070, partial [Cyanobacteria bacterium REEB65]|nr:hypothetical protein [Cyanobacteria bacterium REEB65]